VGYARIAIEFLPLVSVFNQTGEKAWHLFVPALAQNTLMLRVLKGEGFSAFPKTDLA
jgi:sodium transport system permease protein